MKRIGIISAMWVEAALLHTKMTNVREHEISGMKYYEGQIEKQEVVLSACGVGKVNAAIFTQIMIDRFGVDAILHTGIAGSMDDRAAHLSLVVANALTYYDVRKEQMIGCFPYQEIFRTDETLCRLAVGAAGEKVHVGLIITGDDFIADREKKAQLKAKYDALCVEMEGAAVANTAFINQIPFVVIRCISDLADGAAAEDYKGFEQKAAEKAAGVIVRLLKSISGC